MKQTEEATKAYNALHSIRIEDVQMLSRIEPRLAIIVNYTVQDIKENKNGERDAIREVKETLQRYLEERLEFYEGQL